MDMLATESGKFLDPAFTATGEPRARVAVAGLHTVWLNTGTLCNLTCENCYIESSPTNDRLSYLSRLEVADYLREIAEAGLPVREIGVTGGEPFMNPDILGILEDCLERNLEVLVLTNAMRPMMKLGAGLKALAFRFADRLTVRVSLDHHQQTLHEEERGFRSWQPALDGLKWLEGEGFRVHVAGRTRWGDQECALRRGFEQLFQKQGIRVNAWSKTELMLFPEMDAAAEVPEITSGCWASLGVDPADMMCATARMIVKRKGADRPEVVACTLLPHEQAFSLGDSLAGSLRPVALNHPHCARFCVLGGGNCSG